MAKSKYRAVYIKDILSYFSNYAASGAAGIPQLSKFARSIGVTLRTLENWRREHPPFDDACEECMAIQAEIIRDGGLLKVFDSQMARFILSENVKKDKGDGDHVVRVVFDPLPNDEGEEGASLAE